MKIITINSYEYSSVFSLLPCVRVVISYDSFEYQNNYSKYIIEAKKTFLNVIGYDIEYEEIPNFTTITSFSELFLQSIRFFQKINNHPIKNIDSIKELDNKYIEVVFDVSKIHNIDAIVTTALLFVNTLGRKNSAEFNQAYHSLHKSCRFGLSDLFKYDKAQALFNLGIQYLFDNGKIHAGYGKHHRIISAGYSSQTSILGKKIAGNKDRSSTYFSKASLPAPQQIFAQSKEDSIVAANKIGYPVVLKPRSGHKGKAVSVNLNSDNEIAAAYDYSKNLMGSLNVVVEKYIEGDDHRILVVDYQVVAVVKRIPATIIGDGINSIKELISMTNKRERRDGLKLFPIKIDAEVERILAKNQLTLSSILQKGEELRLRAVSNQSLGGTTLDLTDIIHPDNIQMAIECAKISMLDIAGVDFVTTDISKSHKDGFGGIVEINAGPGVDLHMLPSKGKARNVSYATAKMEFKNKIQNTIPVISVLGKKKRKSVLFDIASSLHMLGFNAGIDTGSQIYLSGEKNTIYPLTRRDMLINKTIDSAVIAESSFSILQNGIPYRSVNVTVLSDDFISDNLKKRFFNQNIEKQIISSFCQLTSDYFVIEKESIYFDRVCESFPNQKLFVISHKSMKPQDYKKYNSVLYIQNNALIYILKGEKHILQKSVNPLTLSLQSIAVSLAYMKGNFTTEHIQLLIKQNVPYCSIVQKYTNGKLFVTLDPKDIHIIENIENNNQLIQDSVLYYDHNLIKNNLQNIPIESHFGTFENIYDEWFIKDRLSNKKEKLYYISYNKDSRQKLLASLQRKTTVQKKDINKFTLSYIAKYFHDNYECINDTVIDSISIGKHVQGKKSLVIIDDIYDINTLPLIEEKIIQAFKDGAFAVISPIYPQNLERFYNLIVSNRINLGMKYISHLLHNIKHANHEKDTR